MFSGKKAQAALEYLTTYGWAIMAAIVALGALSYFGFMNPTSLLPDKCDFGKQLECVDYLIQGSEIKIMFRNNFGKEIEIADARGQNIDPTNVPVKIIPGDEEEVLFLISGSAPPKGEKKDVLINITFRRGDIAGSPSHSLVGSLFTTVQ